MVFKTKGKYAYRRYVDCISLKKKNIYKEVDIVFQKKKIEVLELENVITKMKYSLKVLNSKFELPE